MILKTLFSLLTLALTNFSFFFLCSLFSQSYLWICHFHDKPLLLSSNLSNVSFKKKSLLSRVLYRWLFFVYIVLYPLSFYIVDNEYSATMFILQCWKYLRCNLSKFVWGKHEITNATTLWELSGCFISGIMVPHFLSW